MLVQGASSAHSKDGLHLYFDRPQALGTICTIEIIRDLYALRRRRILMISNLMKDKVNTFKI